MKNWFCFDKKGLEPVVKIAAFDAGYLVAKKNRNFKEDAAPVVDGILKAIGGGTSNESMNVVFKDAINALIGQIDDELIKMNILAVLDMVKFNPNLPTAEGISNEQIKGLVESFMQGVGAVK